MLWHGKCLFKDLVGPQESVLTSVSIQLIDDIVQLKWAPTRAQVTAMETTHYSDGEAGSFVLIRIDIQDELGLLEMSDGHVLGVLSNRTFRALNNLSKTRGMTFQPLVHEAEWNEKLEFLLKPGNPKGKVSVNMNMNLILSGPRCAATQVARILASEDRFLQDPVPGAIHHPYENPQSLRLPETQPSSKTQQNMTQLLEAIEADQFADSDQNGINTKIQPATMDLHSFLSNFPTHDNLAHVSMGSCVTTKLFRYLPYPSRVSRCKCGTANQSLHNSHQQKAVDFILRREQGQRIPDCSLWRKAVAANNVEWYANPLFGKLAT